MTAKILKHKFQSAVADGADATMVRPAHDWNDDHDFWFGSRAVGATTDTITHADHLSLVTYNNAGGVAVGLAAPAGGNMPNGWRCTIRNLGIGNVTVTGSGGATINGSASVVLATGNVLELFSLGVADYVAMIPVTRVGDNTLTAPQDFQGVTKLKGTATNDAAAAGYVGQYLESVVLGSGNAYPGSGQYANVVPGLTLPAGDWLLRGVVNCQFVGVTDNPLVFAYLSNNTSTPSNTSNSMYAPRKGYAAAGQINTSLRAGPIRVSTASSQTWYLLMWAQFSGGGSQLCTMWGTLSARRYR